MVKTKYPHETFNLHLAMLRLLLVLFVNVLMFSVTPSSAQSTRLSHPVFNLYETQKQVNINSRSGQTWFFNDIKNNVSVQKSTPYSNKNTPPVLSSKVIYTAFFCKMEMNIHQRFNVWIKIRAGDFDSYELKENK